MKTSFAEGYQKNEPQSIDNFAKELNAMLDRTINRISQDSSKIEKIDQFFSQSDDPYPSSVDATRDSFNAISMMAPHQRYGHPEGINKNAFLASQYEIMKNAGFPVPGRYPTPQGDTKDEKQSNSMGNPNANKNLPNLDATTQQAYQARQAQQMPQGYPRNQMQQATQAYPMPTPQQILSGQHAAQTQAMQQRQPTNSFDPSKQMNPMMQAQKMNQAPQGSQMVQNFQNQTQQTPQNQALLAKQASQGSQSQGTTHEQDSTQKQKAQLQNQYQHLQAHQHANMNMNLNPAMFQQQQLQQQQLGQHAGHLQQQQQQQQQHQQQQHHQQMQQAGQVYQMNPAQMSQAHLMAMKSQQQNPQLQHQQQQQQQLQQAQMQAQQQSQRQQQQQQQQQQQYGQQHQQYNQQLNFGRNLSQEGQAGQAGQTGQAQTQKAVDPQQMYLNQFHQQFSTSPLAQMQDTTQKQQQQYLNFAQKAAQTTQAGQPVPTTQQQHQMMQKQQEQYQQQAQAQAQAKGAQGQGQTGQGQGQGGQTQGQTQAQQQAQAQTQSQMHQQHMNQMFQMGASPQTQAQAAQMQHMKQKMQEQLNYPMGHDPKAYQTQQQQMLQKQQQEQQANAQRQNSQTSYPANQMNPMQQLSQASTTDQQSPSPNVNYGRQMMNPKEQQRYNYIQQMNFAGMKGFPPQQMIQKQQEQQQHQQQQPQSQMSHINQMCPSPQVGANQQLALKQQEQQKAAMHPNYQMYQNAQAAGLMQMNEKKQQDMSQPSPSAVNPATQQAMPKPQTTASTPTAAQATTPTPGVTPVPTPAATQAQTAQTLTTQQPQKHTSKDQMGQHFDIMKYKQQIQQQMQQINQLQQMQQRQMTPQLHQQIQQAQLQLHQQLTQAQAAHAQAHVHPQGPGQAQAQGQTHPHQHMGLHGHPSMQAQAQTQAQARQAHEMSPRLPPESLLATSKSEPPSEKRKGKDRSPALVQNQEFQVPQTDPLKMIEVKRSESNPAKEKPQKAKPKKKQALKKASSEKSEVKTEIKSENKTEIHEIKTEQSEKMEIEPLNLNTTVPSTPGNYLSVSEPKKVEPKKVGSKLYEEYISTMQCLSQFDWLEENSLSHKLLPPKVLTPTVVWFLICTDYFSRRDFFNKEAELVIQETFERINNIAPEFMQRITKANLRSETVLRFPSEEMELLIIETLSEGIKDYKRKELNNGNFKGATSLRPPTSTSKPAYTEEDDEWLMETRRYIYDSFKKLQEEGIIPSLTYYDITTNLDLLSKIDLEDLITLYEKELNTVIQGNEKNEATLKQNVSRVMEEERMINSLEFDVNDTIADIKLTFSEDEKFIALMERRQNDTKPGSSEDKDKSARQNQGQEGMKTASKGRTEKVLEDAVCEICNDGDYSDDDLIVFCSGCNISVHQKCYGIPVIPADDWVCDLCINFAEKGKYLRCPLCDKRGGAMKPSTTRADTEFFEYLNPDYHALLRSTGVQDDYDKKPMTFKDLKRNRSALKTGLDFLKSDEELFPTSYHDKLYYDYHSLNEDDFTEEELRNEPVPSYVWVHIPCVQFIPELYFGDKVQMTNVQGIEDVDRDRFRHECEVCKKRRRGAIVNCERASCKKGFHPECARRGKQYLDIRENNMGQFIYNIYCDKHTPLQLRRMIEAKDKKKRDEVNKFFKAIDKYYMTYLSEPQSSGLPSGISGMSSNFGLFASEIPKAQKKKSYVTTTTMAQPKKEDFLKLVEKYKKKMCKEPCSITLQEKIEDGLWESKVLYDIIDIQPPLDKDRELLADDDIWEVMPYKGLTADQKYRKYKELTEAPKKHAGKGGKTIKKKEVEQTDVVEPSEVKEASETKDPNEISEMSEEFISDFRIDINSDPEFKMRLIKMSYIRYCSENTAMSLPFTMEYLAASLVVDDINPHETLVCSCKKPYRGEILLTCQRCKDRYHPKCVDLPANINPEDFKWSCPSCLSSSNKPPIGANGIMHNIKPMGMGGPIGGSFGGLPLSLIGKRPQNNISEEDPDPAKRLNIGINGRNFY